MKPTDIAQYQATLAAFRTVRPLYERLGEHVQAWCRTTAADLGLYPIVMGRAKTIASFAEKICRPGKRYGDPLREVTDLCGVRVILHTLDDVRAVAAAVEREFVIDAGNSEDKQDRLAHREFGYLSRHYILQLRQAPAIEGLGAAECERLAGLRFELQLRTLAQHLWADVYHVLGYKNEFRLPGRWEREFARLAALLEECDKGFQAIKDAMRTYESNYSAYMSQQDLAALAERMETLLEIDPDNPAALHRLLRARLSMDDAAAPLAAFMARYGARLDAHNTTLRDKGVALCQVHPPQHPQYAAGVACLRRAVAADPLDVEALCSLGGALRRGGAIDEAIDCYRQAHELDPANPYPLGNFIAEELLRRRDAGILRFFRAAIFGAAERCERQVEAHVNLPWALFDLGVFALYRGDPNQAASYYARAIAAAPRNWMIRSAGAGIERFLRAELDLPGVAALDKMLKLAWWWRAAEEERRVSPWQPAPGGPAFGARPVIVLAGGNAGMQGGFEKQLSLLGGLLGHLRGTLIGGGTRSGVAGLVGELQQAAGPEAIHSVGYVPLPGAADVESMLDPRYARVRRSDGVAFSVLEPLKYWEDLAAAGGDPAAVRVLGFNGGAIAAAEFRIALAFGAQVGVVQGSGRAADDLLADPHWKDHPRLHALAMTRASVDAFLACKEET